MRHKRLKLIIVLLLGFGLTGLQAQEVILANGGNALGNEGSVSYSVGQITYTTKNATVGSMAEGVQQPYEISIVTGIEEAKNINHLMVSVYPNPTSDYLTLKVDASTTLQSMSYRLFDMNGKLLESKKIEGNETSIIMSNFISTTYFLKIVQTLHAKSQQEIKTFKIIKN